MKLGGVILLFLFFLLVMMVVIVLCVSNVYRRQLQCTIFDLGTNDQIKNGDIQELK